MVILKYRLTEEEFFDFHYYTSWASPYKRGYRIRYVVRVITLYLVIAAIYMLTISKNDSPVSLVIFAAPALIYFLLIPTLIRRGIRQRVRATLAHPENRNVLDESEVLIMDTGIVSKDTSSESKYGWDAIVRKEETPGYYYLYTNSQHAIVIPKRVIANAGERQELQALFNQHLSLSSEFPEQ
jgi:hypothetical protein